MTGENVREFFANESGGHRWQRIPPTEKRGRVQTSTVTVAVMDAENQASFELNRDDVDRKYCCSGGKGGQNVNRRSTCVVLTHRPTGIMVRSEENRTQGKNEEAAWKRLKEKLSEIHSSNNVKNIHDSRMSQIGYGDRNDKKRTYREKDGFVIDHDTDKKITFKDLYKGNINGLHKA